MEKKKRNDDLQGFTVNDFVDTTSTTSKVEQSTFNQADFSPTDLTDTNEPTVTNEQPKRTSSKQRKELLEEYQEMFLRAPKIIDRQPIFISRELRDKIDEIVRKLGERKMSVSGFAENVLQYHLESYKEEVEKWKRL